MDVYLITLAVILGYVYFVLWLIRVKYNLERWKGSQTSRGLLYGLVSMVSDTLGVIHFVLALGCVAHTVSRDKRRRRSFKEF